MPSRPVRSPLDAHVCCKRSRTTSDLEMPRTRDSASISATSASGNLMVIDFILQVYYMTASLAIHTGQRAYRKTRLGRALIPSLGGISYNLHTFLIATAPELKWPSRLHLQLPGSRGYRDASGTGCLRRARRGRSEEHTSEL